MFWRKSKSKGKTLDEVFLDEVFERLVEKVERGKVPLVAVGVSGRKGLYAEILYRLRFRYLGWSAVDGGYGGCFSVEFPVCLRTHVVGRKMAELEGDYNGCYVYAGGGFGEKGELSYEAVKEKVEAGIELSPKSYALHFISTGYPLDRIVEDFGRRVNFLSFYRQAGAEEKFLDNAVYLLGAAAPFEVEYFGLSEAQVHFLESGTADRLNGLLIMDGEVVPVVLPLTDSGYFEAKIRYFRQEGAPS